MHFRFSTSLFQTLLSLLSSHVWHKVLFKNTIFQSKSISLGILYWYSYTRSILFMREELFNYETANAELIAKILKLSTKNLLIALSIYQFIRNDCIFTTFS